MSGMTIVDMYSMEMLMREEKNPLGAVRTHLITHVAGKNKVMCLAVVIWKLFSVSAAGGFVLQVEVNEGLQISDLQGGCSLCQQFFFSQLGKTTSLIYQNQN